MKQQGQLREQPRHPRQLLAPLRDQVPGTNLLLHPFFNEWPRCSPQIHFWIQLAPEALDVEQGFLQQHQLRLDFHLKTTRSLEQPHQHQTQRYFAQRPIETGFTYGTHGRFQFVHARLGGHPARLDVQFGDTAVVALEKGHEILYEVFLVKIGERSDDAKIEQNDPSKSRRIGADLNIARMHVGMEKAVVEHLGEEQFHAIGGKRTKIHSLAAQFLQLADGNATHAFHHDDFSRAKIPVHLRNQRQLTVSHIAAQLGGIGSLTHQVEFIMQILVEFFHHGARLQAPRIHASHALNPAGHPAHQADVFFHDRLQIGPQHLHRHLMAYALAIDQIGIVHLGHRGASHGLPLEMHEQTLQRLAEGALNGGNRHIGGKRRHAVLQFGQFDGHVRRQQIASRGKHLAKLDKQRAQFFKRHAQPHPPGRAQVTPQRDQPPSRTQAGMRRRRQDQFVEPIAEKNPEDINAAQPFHAASLRFAVRFPRLAAFAAMPRSKGHHRIDEILEGLPHMAQNVCRMARRLWADQAGKIGLAIPAHVGCQPMDQRGQFRIATDMGLGTLAPHGLTRQLQDAGVFGLHCKVRASGFIRQGKQAGRGDLQTQAPLLPLRVQHLALLLPQALLRLRIL